MPQIRIEYSANVASSFDARGFAGRVHEIVPAMVDTDLGNCKTRLVELSHFLVGDGSSEHAMIHVDVRILSGRSQPQKEQLGKAVLAALEESVRESHLKVQMTVEVRELDRDNYHKRLI